MSSEAKIVRYIAAVSILLTGCRSESPSSKVDKPAIDSAPTNLLFNILRMCKSEAEHPRPGFDYSNQFESHGTFSFPTNKNNENGEFFFPDDRANHYPDESDPTFSPKSGDEAFGTFTAPHQSNDGITEVTITPQKYPENSTEFTHLGISALCTLDSLDELFSWNSPYKLPTLP